MFCFGPGVNWVMDLDWFIFWVKINIGSGLVVVFNKDQLCNFDKVKGL